MQQFLFSTHQRMCCWFPVHVDFIATRKIESGLKSAPERRQLYKWFLSATLFFGLLATACQAPGIPPAPWPPTATPIPTTPGEIDVAFESIYQDEWGVNDEMGNQAQIFLITASSEITKVKDLISQEALAQLQQVNFQDNFVLALFQGVQPSSNHKVVIERITRKGNQLIVYAQFWEPNPVTGSAAAHTSPYQLVKLAKDDLTPTQIELVMRSYTLTPTAPSVASISTPAAPTTTEGEVKISFETIAQNEWGFDILDIYKIGPEPRLFWINSSTEVVQIQDFITPEARSALEKINFQEDSVIALFRGVTGSSNHPVVIEQITQQDGHLIIYAQFWEPASNQSSATVITSPYYLVKLAKTQIAVEKPTLILRSYALTLTPPP